MIKNYEKWRTKILVLVVAVLLVLLGNNNTVYAQRYASSGIAGNGTNGIYIDINAAPYSTFQTYSYGQYAMTTSGCAWYASARVNQLTGKGNVVAPLSA